MPLPWSNSAQLPPLRSEETALKRGKKRAGGGGRKKKKETALDREELRCRGKSQQRGFQDLDSSPGYALVIDDQGKGTTHNTLFSGCNTNKKNT